MKIVLFYHSLVSDWNHGNAHFLRGILAELMHRGHEVKVFEPRGGWSRENLVSLYGEEPIRQFHRTFPDMQSTEYTLDALDLERELQGASLVIVHEWNDPELVRKIGSHRKLNPGYKLLFHDTHHRSLTEPEKMRQFDLSGYDGVLAYGEVIKEIYLSRGWIQRAWTWHEAADVRIFHPIEGVEKTGDLIWIGNWGDEERTQELYEYLLKPVRNLSLKAMVHGVRYPESALRNLEEAGIEYGGWLPNYMVPEVFARFRLTVHIPRKPYAKALKGIPTIRPFEALACGIPLVSSPWEDSEGLFTSGEDFLMASNEKQMESHIKEVLNDKSLAESLSRHGRLTILKRHTCGHRVDELLKIYRQMGIESAFSSEEGPSPIQPNKNEEVK
ncbi:MAG: glycosyltransferase [Ignavibacteria bacterium]|jgi:spore maturation protein CgeB|nr:glycosyltransferase [Ignavibacteria bacterium]MCU7502188.1 glycosyltransferase [Ignavibacteria bacterium]MCU7517405.1 glycosyltransferase [Ignavibacteria bacterium]